MNQDHSPVTDSNAELRENPRNSYAEFRKGPRAEEIVRMLTAQEALRELGLNDYSIYAAVRRRELRPVQRGGKGRIFYLEDELRALAERLGKCPYTWAGAA